MQKYSVSFLVTVVHASLSLAMFGARWRCVIKYDRQYLSRYHANKAGESQVKIGIHRFSFNFTSIQILNFLICF